MSIRSHGIAWAAVLAVAPAFAQQAAGNLPVAAFQVRTAGDLAALCGVVQTDPNYVAAIHFCHGFLQGVGQYHGAVRPVGGRVAPMFCPPEPRPPVGQVAGAFASWARASPQYANESAIDGLSRWARATYPCAAQR